jgi:hypothetical protein
MFVNSVEPVTDKCFDLKCCGQVFGIRTWGFGPGDQEVNLVFVLLSPNSQHLIKSERSDHCKLRNGNLHLIAINNTFDLIGAHHFTDARL